MIKPLTREERADLRARYRDDKLYKAWSHPLMEVERELHQPAPEEIWHLTEKLHVRLRELGEDAPYEIDYVFRDLYEPLMGGDVTKGDAMFTAVVVSTVLLSQMCAARPHIGANPNQACCRALARILTQDLYLPVCGTLLDMLKKERIDLNGKKVIVPVTDYLDEAESSKTLSASTRKEIDKIVADIMTKTKALGLMMCVEEEQIRQLWVKILSLPDMLTRVKQVSPRGNSWQMNMKMVANVLGMMMTYQKMEDNASRACELLGMSNARNYMGNHADFAGSCAAFKPKEHETVVKMVKELEVKI